MGISFMFVNCWMRASVGFEVGPKALPLSLHHGDFVLILASSMEDPGVFLSNLQVCFEGRW